MGKELDANVALSVEGVTEALKEMMTMVAEEETMKLKKFLLCFGTFIAITYIASLRGYKTFFMDLGTVQKYLSQAKAHPTMPHVVIAMLGWFKGETGEKCHLIPLPLVTNSGIQVGKWLEMLVSI